MPVGVTLDRFIKRGQEQSPIASGELSPLLRDIALAAKIVNREVNRAGLVDITGAFGAENVQGESQQKLDVVAHIRFIRALKNGVERPPTAPGASWTSSRKARISGCRSTVRRRWWGK